MRHGVGALIAIGLAVLCSTAHAQSHLLGQLQSLQRTHAAGLEPAGNVYSGFVVKNKPRRIVAPLHEGRCYTLIAVASPSVKRLGVTWYAPNGAPITSAPPAGTDLVLTHCALATGPFAVDLLAPDHDGDFALQLMVVPAHAAQVTPAPPPPDPLTGLVDALTAPLAPVVRLGDYLRAFGGEGAGLEFRITLQRGGCYAIPIAGSAGIKLVSARLRDPNGAEVLESPRQPQQLLQYCASVDGWYVLAVKLDKGGGTVVTAVYQRTKQGENR